MFNIEKFNLTIETKNDITNDELKVREILELCSKPSVNLTNEMLKNISSKQLLIAYKEIYALPLPEKEIIKDMINGQYLIENLSYIKQMNFDDEEIY